jgi:hypothetical protein
VYCFWVVGLLAIGGLFTRAVRRVPFSLWLVPLLVWLSEAPITTGTPRFRAALDPFFILLAACAVEVVLSAVWHRSARPSVSSGRLDDVPAPAGSFTSV